ncbi:MAG: PadR family transcriptional regulator [Gemmatimonadales bacterium]
MTSPERFLPLPPVSFHILVALAAGDRHGYAIMQDVAANTGGQVRLGAGTLYRSIQRMVEQGLVVESRQRPPAGEDDERRRYYRLTPLGVSVARLETERLTAAVRVARAVGLAPGKA